MAETYDYAKLGQTTWHVALFFDNGHEAFADQIHGPELPNLGLAKAWVSRILPAQQSPGSAMTAGEASPGGEPRWWARAERGNYVDESFDHDDEHILDAHWDKDYTELGAEWYATLDTNGVDVIWTKS